LVAKPLPIDSFKRGSHQGGYCHWWRSPKITLCHAGFGERNEYGDPVSSSDQACALGAAMYAATVSGLFPTVEAAMNALQSGYDCTYYPQEEKVEYYKAKFSEYLKFPANK
jgi:hypothetical protein